MSRTRKEPLAKRMSRAKKSCDNAELQALVRENPEADSILRLVAENPAVDAQTLDDLCGLHLSVVARQVVASPLLSEEQIEQLLETLPVVPAMYEYTARGTARLAAALKNPALPDATWKAWIAQGLSEMASASAGRLNNYVAANVMAENHVRPERLDQLADVLLDYPQWHDSLSFNAHCRDFPKWRKLRAQQILDRMSCSCGGCAKQAVYAERARKYAELWASAGVKP